MTDEKISEMKQDPEAYDRLMMQQVQGAASPELKNMVADIQDKFQKILLLEKSVNELAELFQEMATLVKA